ncbi:HK97 family phage prohead protease [Mesorhizobium sp. BR115XR7A]|uniref:HK97 family phage prohead protease n=1 Tax=Mesorhizobium sp. BR115XR7A TaxID=2876645 RepID=UPI001CCE2037|nr:HK97 family phage prohead protease [Mesorhizobium sp. BR115XR7A]MBZ9904786.1 HK97 family phage prohead protease [Mesorhizobium sp. BR115XR7A]MBZ9933031.1 HK97 family phage prohead protease [Mesorhizobium sp. BR1-1-5]
MADPFISGYAIQWGKPAIIGGLWEERFARGSLDKSLRDYPDVVALWSHDRSKPLGRVGNGTLTVKADNIGLWYALTPNPDSPNGQEALATVGRGDLDEVSIGFFCEVSEWDDSAEMPTRLVTQAQLMELSLVTWGAFGKDTSAVLSSDNAASARRRVVAKAEAAMRLRGI